MTRRRSLTPDTAWGSAQLTDRLSHLCSRYPASIGKLVMGDITTPWHHADTDKTDIENWRTIVGVASSGRRPATYTHAAVLQTDYESMMGALNADRPARRPALAYCIGTNVMVGVVIDTGPPIKQEYLNDQPDLLQIGMRIGRGTVDATLGVYDQDTDQFHNIGADVVVAAGPEPIADIRTQFPNAHLL